MKTVDVKPRTYIDSSKEINYQKSTFKTDDIVRISTHKKFLKRKCFKLI